MVSEKPSWVLEVLVNAFAGKRQPFFVDDISKTDDTVLLISLDLFFRDHRHS